MFTQHNPLQVGGSKLLRTGTGTFKEPVITPTVVNGTLVLTLTNKGSWYMAAPTLTIADNASAAVTALAGTVGISGGAITSVPVSTAGHFYTSAPAITFSTVAGVTTIASATAIVNSLTGGVTSVTITNGGTGYSSAPTATFAAPPANVTGSNTLTLTNGYVVDLILGGTNTAYTAAPTISFSGGGGTGAAGIVNFDPIGRCVRSFTLTSPGSGYTSAPTVTVSPVTGANVATCTAVIAGQIALGPTAGFGYTVVPTVSIASPNVEVIPCASFTISQFEQLSFIGPRASDEIARIVFPRLRVAANGSYSLPVPNSPGGIIAITRTATTLTKDAEFSFGWIGD